MSTKLDPIKSTPYMSVVEGRKPRQKVHTTIAHAKSAFDTPKLNTMVTYGRFNTPRHTHGWGAIYQHVGGDWVEIATIRQPTEKDLMPNAVHGDEYETRPWRTNDHRQPVPAVRPSPDSQAEPEPGTRQDVGGVHEGADERGRPGDDQRASGSGHAPEVHLTRDEVLAELKRSREHFEYHRSRFAERGFPYDMELMLRFEGRMNGLMWVVERMPDGTANTKSAE